MRGSLNLLVTTTALLILSACAANQADETVSGLTNATAVVIDTQENEISDTITDDVDESDVNADQDTAGSETESEESDKAEDSSISEVDEGVSGLNRPAWQSLAITNARSGETFSLADFEGQTVFVEPMATWCGNCRRQLNNVGEAKEQLAGEDVVFVALSVETNIDNSTLADYADSAGFDWIFAVATPELLQGLAEDFGRGIVNPPATPHFIIRADGTTSDLVTGIEPAGQIVSQIVAQG